MNVKKLIAGGAILVALGGGAIGGKQIFNSNAANTLASRNGTLQAEVHNTAATVVPFLGPFSIGHCGPAIRIMDQAMVNEKLRKNKPSVCFGPATMRQVINLQKKVHYKPTGIYTLALHHRLILLGGYHKKQRLALQAIVAVRYRAKLRDNVLVIAAHATLVGGSLPYSQSASRSNFPAWPRIPPATDCSGFVTWIAWQAGFGARVGYYGAGSSVGWTGTLALQGVLVPLNAHLQVGDMIFYGSGYPWGHVAMYVGHNNVISHGSTGVKILPYNYRAYGAVRRYIL